MAHAGPDPSTPAAPAVPELAPPSPPPRPHTNAKAVPWQATNFEPYLCHLISNLPDDRHSKEIKSANYRWIIADDHVITGSSLLSDDFWREWEWDAPPADGVEPPQVYLLVVCHSLGTVGGVRTQVRR